MEHGHFTCTALSGQRGLSTNLGTIRSEVGARGGTGGGRDGKASGEKSKIPLQRHPVPSRA